MTGDDSETSAPSLGDSHQNSLSCASPDGGSMVWERDTAPLVSNRLLWFRFRVDDANGKPVTDLQPYMGMAAHAVFVASDFSVFAHVHPDGSVPMAALTLADAGSPSAQTQSSNSIAGMAMPDMSTSESKLPAEVSFPYGFPKPGLYRIFIQVKRHGAIQTGVFDARVN